MKNKKPPKDAPLKSYIKGGKLIISIGIDTLAYCYEESDINKPYNDKTGEYEKVVKITNPLQFAKSVCVELDREEEDGSCPLSDLLDLVCQNAVEDGSLGVKFLKEYLPQPR